MLNSVVVVVVVVKVAPSDGSGDDRVLLPLLLLFCVDVNAALTSDDIVDCWPFMFFSASLYK